MERRPSRGCLRDGVKRLSTVEVETDDVPFACLLLRNPQVDVSLYLDTKKMKSKSYLKRNDSVLNVQSSVNGQSLGNDQQTVGESLHSQLGSPFGRLLDFSREVRMSSDFESSGSRDEGPVFEGVLDGTEAIANSVGNLGNGVRVGS